MKYEKIKNQINKYMESYIKLWEFSGSIAAIKDGEILFKKAYGYANIEHKVKTILILNIKYGLLQSNLQL
ncbi:hypothetical protein SAMN02745134_01548 [Clostridium acidisoli DSM 12555]|uniref:Beta-lactamase n=1 Tax=Clostridium acidisoli DSM 12555 TaxID=1121291 RepID=A0A1W1XES2_9CLOT|nr:hypothetical protein [Clostridium acidisoli]SMC22118.1 hypothetical protein SAMN02745134_01548 [Clostridium acidisoli DSM 12555]